MHSDLTARASVATPARPWVHHAGFDEKLLEDAGPRRTALVCLSAGGTLPLAGDTGSVDVLVLDGDLAGHRTGMFLHDAPRALTSVQGCMVFVKQRPVIAGARRALDIAGVVFEPPGSPLRRAPLHADAGGGQVVLLRFAPGCHVPAHDHVDGEEFFVLEGELRDEHGTYGPHTWVRQPHASVHTVDSPRGALLLTFAHHLR